MDNNILRYIDEEITAGKQDWTKVNVRTEHIQQSDTTYTLGDDWKRITFDDEKHDFHVGSRYQFDSNVYMVVNSDFCKDGANSTAVRRCNNTMNFYNSSNSLINEPCIIDTKPLNATLTSSDVLTTQSAKIYVITQYNANTKGIKADDRFLFGGQAFKVIFAQNYLQSKTYDFNSVPLIGFYMLIDTIDTTKDDVVNNIAGGLTHVVTPVQSTTASITYKSLSNIYINASTAKVFTSHFFNSSNVEITTPTAVWSLTNVSTANTGKINVVTQTLVNTIGLQASSTAVAGSITLHLTDSTGAYSADLVVNILNL